MKSLPKLPVLHNSENIKQSATTISNNAFLFIYKMKGFLLKHNLFLNSKEKYKITIQDK